MTDPKNSRTEIPLPIQRLKEESTRRRSLINELNFTYKRLLRMLPGMARSVDTEPVKHVLIEQDRMDRVISERLAHVATEEGEPPEPCACDEASAMVEAVHHADRAAPTKESRAYAIVRALKALRIFLIRVWDRLIGTLSPAERSNFLQEAKALQKSEAELHRELVSVGQRIDPATGQLDAEQHSNGIRHAPDMGSDRP